MGDLPISYLNPYRLHIAFLLGVNMSYALIFLIMVNFSCIMYLVIEYVAYRQRQALIALYITEQMADEAEAIAQMIKEDSRHDHN